MPTYRCVVPLMTQIQVGAEATVLVSLDSDDGAKIHRGAPGAQDRDFQVRFTIDRTVVEVVGVQPLQSGFNAQPGTEEFAWTPTRFEPTWGTYVINQRIGAYVGVSGDEANPLVPAPPFDVALGGLYQITLRGVKPGTCLMDLVHCRLGAFDHDSMAIDGIINVVPAMARA